MTEKRFIRNIIGQVYDSENDKFFEEDYGGKSIGYEDDLVMCLNTLHEENEHLKQFKNSVFYLIDKSIKEIKELFEEDKIDLNSYNSAMITLTGLKEELER